MGARTGHIHGRLTDCPIGVTQEQLQAHAPIWMQVPMCAIDDLH